MNLLEKVDVIVDPARDFDPNAERSFNRIRVFAGLLGFVLPLWLIIGDKVFSKSSATVRDSLSAYYHSGMRDTFVGILVATGVCLVAYRITDKGDRRNVVSSFAGLWAIAVAFFPTGIPEDDKSVELTELQKYFGEDFVSNIHGTSAFLLIGALCVMSIIFWRREKLREEASEKGEENHDLHRFGSVAHLACVVVMLVSCAWIGINFAVKKLTEEPLHEDFLLYGESGALWGFAVSFVAQGFIHRTVMKREIVSPGGEDELFEAMKTP